MNQEIQQAFYEAVRNNRVEDARWLIEQGADVNVEYEKKYSGGSYTTYPIFSIMEDADIPMLQLLLAAGADVNQRNRYGETPLVECEFSSHRLVQAFIAAGADVNARADDGCTALWTAAIQGAPESVKLLLEAGAHVNVHCVDEPYTPYDVAEEESWYHGNEDAAECARLLLAAGALKDVYLDIEECPRLSEKDYAFLYAVQHKDLPAMRAALESGADVNATDRYGMGAMYQAVAVENAEMCRALVQQGISAELIAAALEWPWKPLRHDNIELISYLLSCLDGELLRTTRENILRAACSSGCVAAVRLMLQAGTDPNCGQSPLALAHEACDNKEEILQLLQAAGALPAPEEKSPSAPAEE